MKKTSVVLLVVILTVALLFTGCGEKGKYDDAMSLYESGDYAGAAAKFESLGDYEDSASMLQVCNYENAKALLESGSYEDALAIFTELGDYEDSANYAAECNAQIQMQQYPELFSALEGNTWYFNGGADTILNGITFNGATATIAQVSFDGNGKQDGGSNDYAITVNDTSIALTMADGSQMEIPYTLNGDSVTLGNGEYFSVQDIEAGIQGYWEVRYSSFGTQEKHIYFNNGEVKSESASGNNYGYYYYGPYSGKYTINFGGFDTEMRHGGEYFFNIIDGKVAVLNFDHVLSPSSNGFPGEDGYSF